MWGLRCFSLEYHHLKTSTYIKYDQPTFKRSRAEISIQSNPNPEDSTKIDAVVSKTAAFSGVFFDGRNRVPGTCPKLSLVSFVGLSCCVQETYQMVAPFITQDFSNNFGSPNTRQFHRKKKHRKKKTEHHQL